MTNIIKHGYLPEKDLTSRKFRCCNCGCEFETDEYKIERTYGQFEEPMLNIYTQCPECATALFKYEKIR